MIISERWKGFFCVVLAASLWGLSGTVAKYLFSQQVNPFDLVQVRLTFSFFFLFLYLLAFNRRLLYVARQDYTYMIIFGFLGVAAVQFTYLYTISKTNVATAIFLQYLAPAMVMIYELLFKKAKLTLAGTVAVLWSVAGGFLIAKGNLGGGFAVSAVGLFSGLASAAAFAFYSVYGKRGLAVYNPWTLMVYGFGAGTVTWFFYRLPWLTVMRYGWRDWLFFLYIAVFASIIPFGFYFKGLRYLTPVKAGLTSTLEPVVAAVLAWLLLGERLTVMQMAGCLLILGAIILIQVAGGKKTEIDPADGIAPSSTIRKMELPRAKGAGPNHF